MALIQKPIGQKRSESISVKVSVELKQEIDDYCAWQDLPSTAYFLTQAALYILEDDKDWKRYRKEMLGIVQNR